MEDITEILHIKKKGKMIDTLENFYIIKKLKWTTNLMTKVESNKTFCLTQ